MKKRLFHSSLFLVAFFALSLSLKAGEGPYFITYDHHLEEPGNLELGFNSSVGKPRNGNPHLASWTELEYGTKGWWTTEVYLEGQSTRHDSTIFTGFRLENRFRLLMREHRVNPVLYVEFENINAASKTMQEVVGFDSQFDHAEPNGISRGEKEREIETKLILGSEFKGWNISENLIFEKNLANAPWEFGYAVGVNRPLAVAASSRPCEFCRENFRAGVEFYGGLGDAHTFTMAGTSQYVAPVLSWELSNGTSFRISPTFGMTPNSHKFLFRFGVSHELGGFGRRLRQMFR